MNIEEFDKLIKENNILILQFGSSSCLPCHSIANKITAFIKDKNIKYKYLSIDELDNKKIASSLCIFSVPTILVYVENKLTIRKSGYFSLEEIFQDIERYQEMVLNI